MLAAERVCALLDYDPDTGVFRWAVAGRDGPGTKGSVAGAASKRYWQITIDGRKYLAHRLAFLYMTGKWPPVHVDHIDGNGFNNRFNNLRLATPSQNHGNRRVRRDSASGITGVMYIAPRKKWWATIRVAGRLRHLGYFGTAQEAAEARNRSAVEHFGNFAKVVR
jgi:hypothetical protein